MEEGGRGEDGMGIQGRWRRRGDGAMGDTGEVEEEKGRGRHGGYTERRRDQ